MKTRYLSLLAGCAAPLMFAVPAPAAFTGLTTENRPNAYGISVVELYAQFDQPGDMLQAVAGTPVNPLNIKSSGWPPLSPSMSRRLTPIVTNVSYASDG
jgi:hypothetical protein